MLIKYFMILWKYIYIGKRWGFYPTNIIIKKTLDMGVNTADYKPYMCSLLD